MVDQELVRQQLNKALDAREEKSFDRLITRCTDFRVVVEMAIKCAELALQTSFFERNTLENMMESCLKHMFRNWFDGWRNQLGAEANKLIVCAAVIEKYTLPSNREKILNCNPKKLRGVRSLAYLLWECCPHILTSPYFPRIKGVILHHYDPFLNAAYLNFMGLLAIADRTHVRDENFFILIDFL